MKNQKQWLGLLNDAQNAKTETEKLAAQLAYDSYYNSLNSSEKEETDSELKVLLDSKIDTVFANLEGIAQQISKTV